MATETNIDYSRKLVRELKDLCKERGMAGCSKKNKSELVNELHEWDVLNNTKVEPAIQKPSDALVDTPAIVSKKTIGVQTSDLNKPKKTTWGSIKSFFSKKAESLKSTISNLISKVKSKLESLKSKEPVKSVKSVITKLFRTKRKTSDSSDIDINRIKIQETNSALKGFTKQYTIEGHEGIDPESFLTKVKPQVIALLSRNRSTKVILVLTCVMERVETKTGKVITANHSFRSNTEKILETTDLNKIYGDAVNKIQESIAKFQMLGSNWRFRSVDKLDINTKIYEPLRGDSYIPLPNKLENKKAIINPQNKEDEECFKWSITIAQNYQDGQKNLFRITKELKKQAEKLNWTGISFPTILRNIETFEKNNPGIKLMYLVVIKVKIQFIHYVTQKMKML